MSGVYTVDLVVADALVENPTTVSVVDLKLHFADEAAAPVLDRAAAHSKKPEIKHMFRPNEQTPPTIVSLVFAVLCALPLVIMLLIVSD